MKNNHFASAYEIVNNIAKKCNPHNWKANGQNHPGKWKSDNFMKKTLRFNFYISLDNWLSPGNAWEKNTSVCWEHMKCLQ